jgi:site-specific DNA-methyltransferase (adenine-specific)
VYILNPYYSHGGITIYHGDCHEILPKIIAERRYEFDLLIADPPYGMRLDASFANSTPNARKNIGASRGYADVIGDHEDFDPTPTMTATDAVREQFWFGADYYRSRLPEGGSWLVWDKREGLESVEYSSSEFELCWSRVKRHRKVLRFRWFGLCGTETQDVAVRVHPNQKPTQLIRRLILMTDTIGAVLDPFMGSGTTLRAAKDLGRMAVGIEIEERYCEVAAKRLAQGVLFA